MDMKYATVKRVLDICSAMLLGVLFSPFFVVVPVLIRLSSPGPVFYKQKRVGKNGSLFDLFKFRSMVVNADEIIAKDKKLLRKFKEADWKLDMKEDPRITKLGRFIRAFTIDEFPQLWNVIRGEMSLVGPRAYRQQEIEEQLGKYPKAKPLMEQVLKVKPGITGPWQTSGRNEVSFLNRAQLDADYAKNHSFACDVQIIFKTPLAMISKW